MKRTRQSNTRECCPLCDMVLANRAAATSHYRSHAKRRELNQRGIQGERTMEWQRPDDQWWFRQGYHHDHLDTTGYHKRKWESQKLRQWIRS